jgi:hypothetical protein
MAVFTGCQLIQAMGGCETSAQENLQKKVSQSAQELAVRITEKLERGFSQ